MAKRLLDGHLRILILAAAALTLLLAPPARAEEQVPADVQQAIAALSHLQAMIEYYYMETGAYPETLASLERAFNGGTPKGSRPVKIPTDPASSKPFVYQLDATGAGYSISVPEPQRYGGLNLSLKPVGWGWMSTLAQRRKFEAAAIQSKIHIEQLATQCEMYAKDHGGKFPIALDELYPNYIARHPQCPLTGKNYLYKPTVSGYEISSPNPEKFGLKVFLYSSSEGMKVEPLQPEQ